jgi:hypothetical protein
MKIYKKGTQVTVGGRKWWISDVVTTVKSETTVNKKGKLNDIQIELIEDE